MKEKCDCGKILRGKTELELEQAISLHLINECPTAEELRKLPKDELRKLAMGSEGEN